MRFLLAGALATLTAAGLAAIRPAVLTDEERAAALHDPGEPDARRHPVPLERPARRARPRDAGRPPRPRVPRLALRGDRARARRPRGLWEQAFDLVGVTAACPERAARLEGRRPARTCDSSRTTSPSRGCRPRRREWTTPRSCSSATASWPRSTAGTTTRARTCRAASSSFMNNDPEADPRCSPGSAGSTTAAGTTSTRWRPGSAPRARSSSTPTPRPATGGRSSRPPGPASSSACPPSPGEPALPVKAWVTEEACRRIARLGGHDLDALRAAAERRDFRPVPLGVQARASRSGTRSRAGRSANVIGRLPGRDPVLSREAVVYTAHHDHLGAKPGPTGETVDLQRRARQRLGRRRHAGDRRGLRRAARAAAPVDPLRRGGGGGAGPARLGLPRARTRRCPPGRLAANINIDGMNIWGRTRDVPVIGLGKSSLDDWIRAIAETQGRVVVPEAVPGQGRLLPLRPPELRPRRRARGLPGRGHRGPREAARAGGASGSASGRRRTTTSRPTTSRRTGTSPARSRTRGCSSYLGAKVADAPLAPAWRPGDEFEAARQKALAELGR